MGRRFGIKPDDAGWTVFDIFTGTPVVIAKVPQIGLQFQDAGELAELLDKPALRADRTLRQ